MPLPRIMRITLGEERYPAIFMIHEDYVEGTVLFPSFKYFDDDGEVQQLDKFGVSLVRLPMDGLRFAGRQNRNLQMDNDWFAIDAYSTKALRPSPEQVMSAILRTIPFSMRASVDLPVVSFCKKVKREDESGEEWESEDPEWVCTDTPYVDEKVIASVRRRGIHRGTDRETRVEQVGAIVRKNIFHPACLKKVIEGIIESNLEVIVFSSETQDYIDNILFMINEDELPGCRRIANYSLVEAVALLFPEIHDNPKVKNIYLGNLKTLMLRFDEMVELANGGYVEHSPENVQSAYSTLMAFRSTRFVVLPGGRKKFWPMDRRGNQVEQTIETLYSLTVDGKVRPDLYKIARAYLQSLLSTASPPTSGARVVPRR